MGQTNMPTIMDSPIPQNDKERVLKFFEVFTENDISKLLRAHSGFISGPELKIISIKLGEYFGRKPYIFSDTRLKELQKNLQRSWSRYIMLMLGSRRKLKELLHEHLMKAKLWSDDTEEEKEFIRLVKQASSELLRDYDALSDATKDFLDKDEPIKNLETKLDDKATKVSNTFPHKIPSGTQWKNFTVRFLDEENLLVRVQGTEEAVNFSKMGFADGRNGKPNMQWLFLVLLAKHGGEITPDNPDASDRYKKIKQKLSEQLQAYFVMEADPFFPYQDCPEKPGNSYKLRMTLIPPEVAVGQLDRKSVV